jgi:hypothetical protein
VWSSGRSRGQARCLRHTPGNGEPSSADSGRDATGRHKKTATPQVGSCGWKCLQAIKTRRTVSKANRITPGGSCQDRLPPCLQEGGVLPSARRLRQPKAPPSTYQLRVIRRGISLRIWLCLLVRSGTSIPAIPNSKHVSSCPRVSVRSGCCELKTRRTSSPLWLNPTTLINYEHYFK